MKKKSNIPPKEFNGDNKNSISEDDLLKLYRETFTEEMPEHLANKIKKRVHRMIDEENRLAEKEKTKSWYFPTLITAPVSWYIPASIAASVLIVFIVGKALLVGPEIQMYDLAETEESDDDLKSSDELSDIPYELANVPASNNDQIEQEDMIDEINQLWHEGKKKEAETMHTEFMKKYSDYPKDELEKKLDF